MSSTSKQVSTDVHNVAESILGTLRSRGVRLRLRNGRIGVVGRRLMTAGLWATVREHEIELVVELKARRASRVARVFEFRLTPDDQWLTLITPPITLADAERQLRDRFGADINQIRPCIRRI